jgi:hypothetical protein
MLMSRARLVILTVSATLIPAIGAASTAVAHEFIVNGASVSKGVKVEVQGGGGVFVETTVASVATHIECGEGLLPVGTANVLEEAGKFKSKLELKACTATTVGSGVEEDTPKCKVSNFAVEGTGELTEAGISNISGTGASKGLAKVEISEVAGAGACSLAGTFELKGATACDLPDYLVTSPGIAIGCNPLGGKELKFGPEPAKLDLSLGIEGAKGQTFSSN